MQTYATASMRFAKERARLTNGVRPCIVHAASPRKAASGQQINFTLIAILFVMTGWPTTEVCLSLVAVIIGLGSTAPDPRMFTAIAVVATPIACLLAGILKYFVFNGVSEFPLLAIGLAPVVIGLALLIAHPNRMLSSLGRLTLVFTMAILAPSNPQNYDPQLFVITTLFACLSSILTYGGTTPHSALVERSPAPAAAGRCAPRSRRSQFLSNTSVSCPRKRRSVMPRGSSKS